MWRVIVRSAATWLLAAAWLAARAGAQSPGPPPALPADLRLLSWNLQWFPGRSPTAPLDAQDAHLREVAAVLRTVQPDILFLQEVKSEAAVAELLAAAGLRHSIHITSRFKDTNGLLSGQQLAITSRFPATEAWQEPWKSGWAGPPRGLVYARLRLPGQPASLHTYSIHLKSNLGADRFLNAAKREDATEQLAAHLQSLTHPDAPPPAIVIAGDFNTSFEQTTVPSELTLTRFLNLGFFWPFDGVPPADRITLPATNGLPDVCFDHFFLKGLGRPVARVITQSQASDHRPIVVEIPRNPAR